MPVTAMETFTWCGRPSGCLSTTSTRLCTEDHDGTASMSASASMTTSGGASMTISDEACTATATKLATAIPCGPNETQSLRLAGIRAVHDQLGQPLHRGVENILGCPLDDETRNGPRRFDGDVETHTRLVDTLGFEVVLDMLAMLLGCPLGIPDHPVGTPVIFQDLFVDEPQNPDGGPHMVGPTVGIAVDHFHLFVRRRPR